jgi:hypothetical protein
VCLFNTNLRIIVFILKEVEEKEEGECKRMAGISTASQLIGSIPYIGNQTTNPKSVSPSATQVALKPGDHGFIGPVRPSDLKPGDHGFIGPVRPSDLKANSSQSIASVSGVKAVSERKLGTVETARLLGTAGLEALRTVGDKSSEDDMLHVIASILTRAEYQKLNPSAPQYGGGGSLLGVVRADGQYPNTYGPMTSVQTLDDAARKVAEKKGTSVAAVKQVFSKILKRMQNPEELQKAFKAINFGVSFNGHDMFTLQPAKGDKQPCKGGNQFYTQENIKKYMPKVIASLTNKPPILVPSY